MEETLEQLLDETKKLGEGWTRHEGLEKLCKACFILLKQIALLRTQVF